MIPDKAAFQAMFELLRALYPAEQWPARPIRGLNDAWTQAMQEDYLSLAHIDHPEPYTVRHLDLHALAACLLLWLQDPGEIGGGKDWRDIDLSKGLRTQA